MARIRIIDDDVEFAENTAALLGSNGHSVSLSDKVGDAVQELLEDRPDLLVLDLMFPDNPVAGFDLARQIRANQELKELPIIMLTGVNQEFPMDFSTKDIDSEWMPVQDFIEKPIDPAKLLGAIEKLLNA